MAFDREAAKQAGYTDEEIDAFIQSKGKKTTMEVLEEKSEPPAPSQQDEISSPGGGLGTLATIGAAVAPVIPEALALGGAAAAYKLGIPEKIARQVGKSAGNIANAYKEGRAMTTLPPNSPIQPTTGPVKPSAGATRIPVTFNQPMPTQTAMPQAAPAQSVPGPIAPQQSITQQVQRIALDKIKQFGPRLGAGMFALTPGELGPKVPQSGPYRGMEINPLTGRPFTEQELAMYR